MDKIAEDMKRHTITYDRSCQVNIKVVLDKLDLRHSYVDSNNSASETSTIRIKRRRGKAAFNSKGRKSMFFPPKDIGSPTSVPATVTEAMPFNFQTVAKKSLKSYNSGLSKYILVF